MATKTAVASELAAIAQTPTTVKATAAANTAVAESPALEAILRNFRTADRKCSPELLEAMHIALDRQEYPRSYGGELPKFFKSKKASEVFKSLESAKLFVLEHPQVKPGVQNLVAYKMRTILRRTLSFRMNYDYTMGRVELYMGRRRYLLPDLENPDSLGAEYTHGEVRICTVYLEQLPGEAGCVVHAREMFCLLALAQVSHQEDESYDFYTVRVVALWNHSQLRILTATIPASFLEKIFRFDPLDDSDGFTVYLSPYYDPCDRSAWEQIIKILRCDVGTAEASAAE